MTLTDAGKLLALHGFGGGVLNTSRANYNKFGTSDYTIFHGINYDPSASSGTSTANSIAYLYKSASNSSGVLTISGGNNNWNYRRYHGIIIGGEPVRYGDTTEIYSLQNYKQISTGNTSSSPYLPTDAVTSYDVDNGIVTHAVPITNTGSESITYTHYGVYASNTAYSYGSNNSGYVNLLLSYYGFPEPIVVQPGETKTIQITFNISNL